MGKKNADGTTTASGTSPSAMYQNTPHFRTQTVLSVLSIATQKLQGVLGITITLHLRTQNTKRVLTTTTTDILVAIIAIPHIVAISQNQRTTCFDILARYYYHSKSHR